MPSARLMTTPVAVADELIEGRYAELGGYRPPDEVRTVQEAISRRVAS